MYLFSLLATLRVSKRGIARGNARVSCRLIALDHRQSDIYLVTLEDISDAGTKREAAEWRQERMQDIQRALDLPLSEHGQCNGITGSTPAVNGNVIHSSAQAGGWQQPSRPDALSNGCSHAAPADEHSLRERRQSHSSAQVMPLTLGVIVCCFPERTPAMLVRMQN